MKRKPTLDWWPKPLEIKKTLEQQQETGICLMCGCTRKVYYMKTHMDDDYMKTHMDDVETFKTCEDCIKTAICDLSEHRLAWVAALHGITKTSQDSEDDIRWVLYKRLVPDGILVPKGPTVLW